jgi:alanine racemase
MTATDAAAVLDIDLAAIAANWRALQQAHGGRPVAAVVKADAYGTGAEQVAPYLLAQGCRHFFTAHLSEALALRPLLPGAMLAALNGPVAGSEAEYAASGILPVLSAPDEVARWSELARAQGRVLPALMHIDTGMHRRGLSMAETQTLAATPGALDGIGLRYVMTHLASSEEPDNPENAAQLARFTAACALLPPAPRSVANSSALFLGPEFRSDLARPGVALYGGNPMPGQPNPMRPVVRLRARVLQVRDVVPGEGVGYNATWRAQRPSRIAIVGVGYADGYPRALSGCGAAHADGASFALVGRVSMDLSAFDVTDQPAIAPGAWLDLIGPDSKLETVAAQAGTIPYEILTRLGRRYARVWHG